MRKKIITLIIIILIITILSSLTSAVTYYSYGTLSSLGLDAWQDIAPLLKNFYFMVNRSGIVYIVTTNDPNHQLIQFSGYNTNSTQKITMRYSANVSNVYRYFIAAKTLETHTANYTFTINTTSAINNSVSFLKTSDGQIFGIPYMHDASTSYYFDMYDNPVPEQVHTLIKENTGFFAPVLDFLDNIYINASYIYDLINVAIKNSLTNTYNKLIDTYNVITGTLKSTWENTLLKITDTYTYLTTTLKGVWDNTLQNIAYIYLYLQNTIGNSIENTVTNLVAFKDNAIAFFNYFNPYNSTNSIWSDLFVPETNYMSNKIELYKNLFINETNVHYFLNEFNEISQKLETYKNGTAQDVIFTFPEVKYQEYTIIASDSASINITELWEEFPLIIRNAVKIILNAFLAIACVMFIYRKVISMISTDGSVQA